MSDHPSASSAPKDLAKDLEATLEESLPTGGEDASQDFHPRWDASSEDAQARKPKLSQQAAHELADARKLAIAICLGLIMAFGLTIAAAWGPDPQASRTSAYQSELTPQILEKHLPT